MNQVGRLYGLRSHDLPRAWAGFVAHRDHVTANGLVVSKTLIDVLESIFHLPLPPFFPATARLWRLLAWLPSHLSRLVTVGMVPPSLRDELHLRWTPIHDRDPSKSPAWDRWHRRTALCEEIRHEQA
jgi:uncharacterized protein (DUF2236 family)